MDDPLVRLIVAAAIVSVGVGWSLAARAGARRRSRTTPLDLTPFAAAVVFFTDAACRSCAAARRVLDEAGVGYDEVDFGHEPDVVRRVGVTAVPLIVVRDDTGAEAGRIAGVPTGRELRRLLDRAAERARRITGM